MKILLLTFYYSPDLCAGSFRATPLAKELASRLTNGDRLEVLTTLPNRYKSFSSEAQAIEKEDRISITRIRLPAHQSGMFDQSKAFIRFARAALRETKGKRYDVVVATSSRLMTAALGATIAKREGSKLYLDIRDIFVDTINDVLSKKIAPIAKFTFSYIEKYAVRRAEKINLVSAGFLPYFHARYPGKKYSVITNGIDDAFLMEGSQMQQRTVTKELTVVYAGNMGEGQGLHEIIPPLAKRFEGSLRFLLIGDGGRKARLVEAIQQMGCKNVEILEPVSRTELIQRYRSADILFLHLNDYDAFLKVLPSKIFEYAALEKPIWAGVAGYAAQFLDEHVDNAAVFPPCKDELAAKRFETLDLQHTPRPDFIRKFSRSELTKELADDIADLTCSAT